MSGQPEREARYIDAMFSGYDARDRAAMATVWREEIAAVMAVADAEIREAQMHDQPRQCSCLGCLSNP